MLQEGAVVLLMPVRLGMHTIDPSYMPKVSPILGIPQSLGFVGGHPNSAHYFVATQGSQALYLDPHAARPAVSLAACPTQPLHASWHCRRVSSMALQDVDGSVAFGFYCADEGELDALCQGLQQLAAAAGGYAAINVAEDKAQGAAVAWDEEADDDEACLI
mmetsp:Transcript_5794/g.11129  ORF Transcript_5794/g.11129 Transcript_5794/m.11129 type:complete len:161 (-) Transcript_5794:661-1143(-)